MVSLFYCYVHNVQRLQSSKFKQFLWKKLSLNWFKLTLLYRLLLFNYWTSLDYRPNLMWNLDCQGMKWGMFWPILFIQIYTNNYLRLRLHRLGWPELQQFVFFLSLVNRQKNLPLNSNFNQSFDFILITLKISVHRVTNSMKKVPVQIKNIIKNIWRVLRGALENSEEDL